MTHTPGNAGGPRGERAALPGTAPARDDRIFPETRWIGACIPPFLLIAFVLLYLLPDQTDRFFAWTITPAMTPLLMGAGYIAGSYFFVRLVGGGRWHWYTHGFVAIGTFTWFMALATFLHWDQFHHDYVTFYGWLGLYLVTPFLVPLLWLRNRRTDPGPPDPVDVVVPARVRLAASLIGTVMLALALLMFIVPDVAISIWPWKLTALTSRVIAGWFALPGVMGLMVARDSRWSAWRVLMESQVIALTLILVGVARAWGDFDQANPLTWVFVGSLALLLVALVILHVTMQQQQRRPVQGRVPS